MRLTFDFFFLVDLLFLDIFIVYLEYVQNEPGNRLAFKRPAKKPVLVHPEVMTWPFSLNLQRNYAGSEIDDNYIGFFLKERLSTQGGSLHRPFDNRLIFLVSAFLTIWGYFLG